MLTGWIVRVMFDITCSTSTALRTYGAPQCHLIGASDPEASRRVHVPGHFSPFRLCARFHKPLGESSAFLFTIELLSVV